VYFLNNVLFGDLQTQPKLKDGDGRRLKFECFREFNRTTLCKRAALRSVGDYTSMVIVNGLETVAGIMIAARTLKYVCFRKKKDEGYLNS
jgi:hypothetical protein